MKRFYPRRHQVHLSPPSRMANALSHLHKSSRHRQRITTTTTITTIITTTITMQKPPLPCPYLRLANRPPQSVAKHCSTVSLKIRDVTLAQRCIRRKCDRLHPERPTRLSNLASSAHQSRCRALKAKRTAPSTCGYPGSTYRASNESKSVYGGRSGGRTCTRMIRTRSRRRCMRDGYVANGRMMWTCRCSTWGAVKIHLRQARRARLRRSRHLC